MSAMRQVSLILAEKEDIHVKAVLQHLSRFSEQEILWLDTERALEELSFSLSFDIAWTGELNGFPFDRLNSIWYRRPKRPKAKEQLVRKDFRTLVEDEMRHLLHNLYRIADCEVLPHPGFNREADHKLLQLNVARACGLNVPKTVVTNQPGWEGKLDLGTDFYCIKAIGAYHWIDEDGAEYSLKSSRVSRDELRAHSEDLALCPTLVQPYINKLYEWRITVVKDKLFCCRLDTQRVAGAEHDWRIADVSAIRHELIEIPSHLRDSILMYLQKFNLSFGAFDFIQTHDGEFVFLECNPNGQWLWIENFTGAPISAAIADVLFGSKPR